MALPLHPATDRPAAVPAGNPDLDSIEAAAPAATSIAGKADRTAPHAIAAAAATTVAVKPAAAARAPPIAVPPSPAAPSTAKKIEQVRPISGSGVHRCSQVSRAIRKTMADIPVSVASRSAGPRAPTLNQAPK